MTITAIVNSEEVYLDEVWVFGFVIPADGIFRRITFLSFKQVAIVGVNVRVQCTNGAETDDCSVPIETTEEIQSTTQDIATTAAASSLPDTENPTNNQDSSQEDTTTEGVPTTTETTVATTVAQSDTPATTAASEGTANTRLGNIQDLSVSAMPQGGILACRTSY